MPDEHVNLLRFSQRRSAQRIARGMVFLGVLVGLVGAFLFFMPYYTSPDLQYRRIWAALAAAQPFSVLAIWLAGLRLARIAGPNVTSVNGFWANVLALAVLPIVPGRLSEAAKPIALNLQTGLPIAQGVAAVAFERILDAAFLALLGIMAVTGVASQYGEKLLQSAIFFLLFSVAGGVVLCIVALHPKIGSRVIEKLPSTWLKKQASHSLSVILHNARWERLGWPIFLSALIWASSYLIFFVFLKVAAVVPLDVAEILLVFVVSTLGLIVTITPGGLGTFEGAIVVALGSFGCPMADAFITAVMLRLAVMLPVLPATAWFVSRYDFSLREMAAWLYRRRRDR